MGHLKTAPPHPSQCAHWDSLPLLAPFGRHFPLTGGISLPPGEGILTPNPPAQNRRPVINVICNSTHVTIPDINITWESNPTHGPARCQYYVPICSGTGSVTPAFCAAKKSIFNFQPQSRAAPCISPAAPSGIARRRVREAAPYRGGRHLDGGGGEPPPYIGSLPGTGGHMGPPLRRKSDRYRWLGRSRRGGGTASAIIFRTPRAQWPGGNLERHSDFARRKCSARPKGVTPVTGDRG